VLLVPACVYNTKCTPDTLVPVPGTRYHHVFPYPVTTRFYPDSLATQMPFRVDDNLDTLLETVSTHPFVTKEHESAVLDVFRKAAVRLDVLDYNVLLFDDSVASELEVFEFLTLSWRALIGFGYWSVVCGCYKAECI